MIQIITYKTDKLQNYDIKYKISRIDEFNSFDDYDINIIDLSDEELWRFCGVNSNFIDRGSDLVTISKELQTTKKSKIIITLPKNVYFRYNWNNRNKAYNSSIKLKNILQNLNEIISKNLLDIGEVDLLYSQNKTTINDKVYKSDFNLLEKNDGVLSVINKSDNSNKITTAIYKNVVITTLNIFETNEHLDEFLRPFQLYESEDSKPEWFSCINFFDDEDLKREENDNNDKIKKLEMKNKKIEDKLEQNNRYKSILYTSGDELVKVVMEMLDNMLEYDSTGFIDEKKEDFLIKREDITFVGEIKGISSAISNKNVSQLDVHVQGYIDKILMENINENVKGLLIINHQRNKNITDRNEVHQNQIDLANRNNSLIIESNVFLKLYELFLEKKLDSQKIIKILANKTGVLQIKDLK